MTTWEFGRSCFADGPGGTAGCVVAGRLSDAFPDLSIVVIENGPESKDNPLVDRELGYRPARPKLI